jgi:hypothetical protein
MHIVVISTRFVFFKQIYIELQKFGCYSKLF